MSDEDYLKWYQDSPEYRDAQYEQWYRNGNDQGGKKMYLYLNFMDNLEKGSQSWDDFYTTSLSEQYEVIKRRIGNNAAETLQQFIASVFAQGTNNNFYISMPGFDRRIKYNRRGKECIYNIVIRPERTLYSSYYLPEAYDCIIIGDLTFGSVIEVTVKGIELIDSKVAKYGEKTVYCTAACAFTNKSFVANGRTITVPDYGTRETHDAVLTRDFIDSLCERVYPIPNPEKAVRVFEQWKKYVEFRKYYLGKQSERSERIADISVIDSYMVTRDVYRKNEETLSGFLLDGHTEFAKGEQIILSKEVNGSDSFPLIRISIEQNRKAIFEQTVGKFGKGKPKYEVHLQRYTKDSMGISAFEPKYDEKGNLVGRNKSYQLGERYLFAFTDIEPDCTGIERTFEKEKGIAFIGIDKKYEGIIFSEVERFIEMQRGSVERKYAELLSAYEQELAKKLDGEAGENKDKEIKKAVEAEIERRLAPYEAKRKEDLKSIRAKLEVFKKKKTLTDEEDGEYDTIRASAETVDMVFYEQKEKIEKSIDVKSYYIARNQKLVKNKKKSLGIQMQSELVSMQKEKRHQLETQYKNAIATEKNEAEKLLRERTDADIATKIEEETIRRYEIYFRPSDITDKLADIRKDIDAIEGQFLTFDTRAEKAKIERQEKALQSLLGGYVKNPYLASYLFAPESLATSQTMGQDPDYCLESLNDSQKLAVKRALQSESIFLLQGPPGTGKTQVIAEITAQYCKQGKKVLISSETHKAIDNVFERLPKIPEIRPLRLIPSTNGKETNYSPERLVDNFYRNIQTNLQRQITRFENYNEAKATFADEMKMLRFEYDKLLRLQRETLAITNKRRDLVDRINDTNGKIETQRELLSVSNDEFELFRRTLKYIDSYRFESEGAKAEYIERLKQGVYDLLMEYTCFEECTLDQVRLIMTTDVSVINQELANMLADDKLVSLENKRKELRARLADLRDPDTDEAPQECDDNYEEYRRIQKEFIDLGNEIKAIKTGSSFDVSESIVYKIVSASVLQNKDELKKLSEQVVSFKVQYTSLANGLKNDIDAAQDRCRKQNETIQAQIDEYKLLINDAKRQIEELEQNESFSEYENISSGLKQRVNRFFRDFNIVSEYSSGDMQAAFDIITDEWNKLETDYQRTQAESKVKIPIYKDICKYLEQEDILEEDRASYTKALYDNVNVFGITCTSRDRFTPKQLAELGKYGIDSVDIRTAGIDVVIIDEVSKSSFLDLLIPILYGKTVILVGDHRQLPPMYDLRHLRENDLEGLDETIISKSINEEYTKLYEECFFKTLYEKVPEGFRVMLNKQYRCHSHIMEVFNHFYGGSSKGLQIGKKQQDDEKEHNLTVRVNENIIVDPSHHIYFVDCDQKESSAYEGSTSKINEQEASVVMELLKALDKGSQDLLAKGKIHFDQAKKIDERPSVGVICTYGDQAGLIKKKRKYAQFKGFSQKDDERLIISTVDDFQGDERDIIIVSMVRNPKDKRFNADFVTKFERINVALSRARKLLIIVGAKKFLSEQTIELPDLTGNHALDKHAYPVYREIVDTINYRGRIWTAQDIIGE